MTEELTRSGKMPGFWPYRAWPGHPAPFVGGRGASGERRPTSRRGRSPIDQYPLVVIVSTTKIARGPRHSEVRSDRPIRALTTVSRGRLRTRQRSTRSSRRGTTSRTGRRGRIGMHGLGRRERGYRCFAADGCPAALGWACCNVCARRAWKSAIIWLSLARRSESAAIF
jgi:hypothetical protein